MSPHKAGCTSLLRPGVLQSAMSMLCAAWMHCYMSYMPLCRSMMTAVQLAQTQLVVALCFANILIAFALCKLSLEMRAHSKLVTSHTALTKQAAGISKEYTRATKADPNDALKEQLDAATARCSDMQVRLWCCSLRCRCGVYIGIGSAW